MPSVQCYAHYSTFARIHAAGPGELAELRSFAATLGRSELDFDWNAALGDSACDVFIAFEGGLLAGAIAVWCDPARITAELEWIGVAPSARRRGIGRLLIEYAADTARERRAAVMVAGDTEPSVGALLVACGARWHGTRYTLPLAEAVSEQHLRLVKGQH